MTLCLMFSIKIKTTQERNTKKTRAGKLHSYTTPLKPQYREEFEN